MLFWVLLIAAVTCSSFYSYKKSKNWVSRIGSFAFLTIICSIFIGLITLFGAFVTNNPSSSDKVLQSETFELKEMNTGKNKGEDSVYLVTDQSKTGARFTYTYTNDGQEIYDDLSVASATVTYGDGQPRLEKTQRMPGMNWIAPGFMRWYVSYEFHVPEGSILVE